MKPSATDSSMSTAKDDDDEWGNGGPSSTASEAGLGAKDSSDY